MQDEPKEGENKSSPPPFLAVRDRWTKCGYAMALASKVASNPTTIRGLGQFLQGLGYHRICNKSDGEAAIVALKKSAAEYAKVDAQPEESPVGDHEANCEIESFIRDIKRRQRAVRSLLEARLGFALEDDDPALAWTPLFCSNQMNRFKVLEDGRTADQRRTGKTWKNFSLQFW